MLIFGNKTVKTIANCQDHRSVIEIKRNRFRRGDSSEIYQSNLARVRETNIKRGRRNVRTDLEQSDRRWGKADARELKKWKFLWIFAKISLLWALYLLE